LKKGLGFVGYFIIAVLLTVITQTGGAIYLFFLWGKARMHLHGWKALMLFFGMYMLFTVLIIPSIVPFFGREPLPLFGNLKPLNIGTVFLNRHYVAPELKKRVRAIADKMSELYPGTTLNYLDANFPFLGGFPLLPHLSHNDGKKIDFAFFYQDQSSGERTNENPSFIGYGAFESPQRNEANYPEICRKDQFLMYNALEIIEPLTSKEYKLDVERTKKLIELLAKDPAVSKIFIEPHLKTRWKLENYDKIRFQGCHSVRHDDHIHVQIF
jgi:hypothetical protein